MKKARILIGYIVYEMDCNVHGQLQKDLNECAHLTESNLWNEALERAIKSSKILFVIDGVYNF